MSNIFFLVGLLHSWVSSLLRALEWTASKIPSALCKSHFLPCWPLFVSRVVVFLALSLILCSFMHFSNFHSRSWFDLLSCNYYPKCIIIRWQTPFSPTIQSSHPPGIFNQICPSIPGTFSQACGLFRHFPYLDYSGNLLPFCFVNLLVWAGHGQPVTLLWVRCIRSLFSFNFDWISKLSFSFRDLSGNFHQSFLALALSLLAGSSVWILEPFLKRCSKSENQSEKRPFQIKSNTLPCYCKHHSHLST